MTVENYFETLPPNLGVFVHTSIIHDNHPIRFVAHDTDGEWSFTAPIPELNGDKALASKHWLACRLGTTPRGTTATVLGRLHRWTMMNNTTLSNA